MKLEVLDSLSQEQFIRDHIAANQPCIIKDANFNPESWSVNAVRDLVGDLSTQIYDTLFDLQDINTLGSYLDTFFNQSTSMPNKVPYVRWYNRLKDVEFPWGDEAFKRLSDSWTLPDCIPRNHFLVPFTGANSEVNPVTDLFPYRGVLVAARGARTRLHRDPFFSDAIVNQFAGVKEFMLYRPERSEELMGNADNSSFGGFVDIREEAYAHINADVTVTVSPGELIYIPHGWLHDALVLEDSISITWNFVHQMGAAKFMGYLADKPEQDPEFEVLKYFYKQAGETIESGQQALTLINDVINHNQPAVAKSA